MYTIEKGGADRRRARIVASEKLDAGDFHRIAAELGTPAARYRKTGNVAARQATVVERIETCWNGKESQVDAAPGDWVVTALAADDSPLRDRDGALNVYVLKERRFPDLYEPTDGTGSHGAIYRPKGVVLALHFEGGFEIRAPWGEMQRADDGWLLLNGAEVYGNHRDTFGATYVPA